MAMRGILLDTSAYAAFRRGQPEAIEVVQFAPVIILNSIVVGELLAGFAAGSRELQNRTELTEFMSSPYVQFVIMDQKTAETYSTVYLELRNADTPIPTNDMWIAASALQHGLDVFSYDGHFRAVAGLRVGASLADLSQ